MLQRINNRKGFTLVELMIVAIIVAILAAVAIPMMTGSRDRAYATEAESSLGTIQTALRAYRAANGVYPTAVAGTSPIGFPGLGLSTGDLLGTFFDDPCFTMTSAAASYTILCDWDAVGNTAPRAAEVANTHTTTLSSATGQITRTGY